MLRKENPGYRSFDRVRIHAMMFYLGDTGYVGKRLTIFLMGPKKLHANNSLVPFMNTQLLISTLSLMEKNCILKQEIIHWSYKTITKLFKIYLSTIHFTFRHRKIFVYFHIYNLFRKQFIEKTCYLC